MSTLDSIIDVLKTSYHSPSSKAILSAQGFDYGNRYADSSLSHNQFERFFQPEIAGTLDMAGFNASKKYELQRMGDRNELAQKFTKDSEIYNLELMQQAQASETFYNRLGQIDTRLGGIKADAFGSASKATSKRQFAQLSQQAMQGTSRYLAELERFKSPETAAIDFTFADPITGEALSIDTKFEDVYFEDTNPSDRARSMVMEDYTRIRDEKADEARTALVDEYGNAEDYWKDQGLTYRSTSGNSNAVASNEEYLTYLNQEKSRGFYGSYNEQMSQQFNAAMSIDDVVTDYSEAAALAEMGQYTDRISGGSIRDQSFDPISLFYQQDVNSVLDDMIGKTTERMEIAGLTERGDVQQEFSRRQEAARQERALFDSQIQRNQQQAVRIEQEKQDTRIRMEQQKRDYAETMSSFAAPAREGSGITFKDNRPQ